MTFFKVVELHCDIEGCDYFLNNGDSTATATRRFARSEGWSHFTKTATDVCPDCKTRVKQQ